MSRNTIERTLPYVAQTMSGLCNNFSLLHNIYVGNDVKQTHYHKTDTPPQDVVSWARFSGIIGETALPIPRRFKHIGVVAVHGEAFKDFNSLARDSMPAIAYQFDAHTVMAGLVGQTKDIAAFWEEHASVGVLLGGGALQVSAGAYSHGLRHFYTIPNALEAETVIPRSEGHVVDFIG